MMQRQGGYYPPDAVVAISLKHHGDAVRLVRGHYHFCMSDMMNDPLIITLLREPVARTISNIKHRTRDADVGPYLDALSEGRLLLPDNMMTRFLGGNIDPLSICRDPRDFLDQDIVERDALLESALQRLKRITCLGLVEHMDLFAESLESHGISIEIGRENVASNGDFSLSDRQMETIRRHNELDTELYRAAEAIVLGSRQPQPASRA